MKALITGASGQLGFDAVKVLREQGVDCLGVSSKELDITDRDAVLGTVREYRPDAVLHCAAYTKVDRAEDEANLCMRVNAEGTRNVALACRACGAKLLYVSTDYVFPGTGDKPWETDDATGPLNVYGKSKLAGEAAVKELVEKHFIVRTSWVIGEHGNNFVKTMLRLAETHSELRVVDDQIGSPTFTADLAPLLCDMLFTEKYGVYHATNEGFCSWAELAEAVFRLTGKDIAVHHVSTEDYGAKALRPKNSRLSKRSLDAGGFARLPGWEEALARMLDLMLCRNGAEEISEFTKRQLRRDDVEAVFHTKTGLQSGFEKMFHMKLSHTEKTDKPPRGETQPQEKMRPGEKYAYLLSKGITSLKQQGTVRTLKRVGWFLKSGYIPQHAVREIESDFLTDIEIQDAYQPSRELYQQLNGKAVDIIVPIYNGTNLLLPLLESIPKTKMPYRLFLIDDKSPDPAILPMLYDYADGRENVTVIENQENLGYTRSINKGLKRTDGHVVLLNTDVRLPMYWLERLMTPILMQSRVASVTPFTNSGTICSFPRFLENNDLYLGLSVDEIDAAFARMEPQYIQIPTGVGFCMALSRDALTAVGLYDEETFPRGYGEENDWCQRAEKAGFRNVMAENLFVYHQHGATFTSEEKQKLIQKHIWRLNKKHPNYDADVQRYIQVDPAKKYRAMAKLLLFRRDAEEAPVLVFSHAWGGGSAYYLDEKIKAITAAGRDCLAIRYFDGRGYQLSRFFDGSSISAKRNRLEQLLPLLPERLGEIWVNELVAYPNLPQLLDQIQAVSHKSGAKLIFRLHDYYCVCPGVTLLDDSGKFCGVCSPQTGSEHCKKRKKMEAWRKTWGAFLSACDEITAFSNNSAQLLRRAYPELQNVAVIPHTVNQLRPVSPYKMGKTLTIGVIGAISEEKGLKILEQMAEIIHKKKLPVRITIIGYTAYEPKYGDVISCTGKYKRDQLPELVEKSGIDIVFIPSILPETFSYTTEESMLMRLPVATFDLGAPAERIRSYPKGIVLSEVNAKTALEEIYGYWSRQESGEGAAQ